MRTRFSLVALTILLVSVLAPAAAFAAPSRIWVSNTGQDSASCGAVTSPCATFQRAQDNVAAGGQIGVLTPGEYGHVFIGKAVSITNDGTGEASIAATADQQLGVWVIAGAGDIVSLRGLVIDGQGIGTFGIVVTSAVAVHIQNCVIRNFEGAPDGYGIAVIPGSFGTPPITLGSNPQVFVSDTIIFNNGSGARTAGIAIQTASNATANVVLDRVHLENNVIGLRVDGSGSTGNGSHVILRDSVASGNAGDGILATSVTGHAPAFILVERTSSVNNAGTGLHADGPHATMLLDEDTVARNGVGLNAVNGGQLISYGNNRVNNNLGADGAPTGIFSPI